MKAFIAAIQRQRREALLGQAIAGRMAQTTDKKAWKAYVEKMSG